MRIWKESDVEGFTPPDHFGNLKVFNVVPFENSNYCVQVSKAPPGGGGEMHHHDTWSQVFYVMAGELTFDTGKQRFTLKAGESVVFDPKDPHLTVNEGDNDSISLVITVKQ
jgi:quercetin dioxygenase-like cupin family protein